MQAFTFYSPTKIIFGKNAEEKTPEEMKEFGGNRILIVYGGGSIVRSGLLPRMEALLKEANLPYALFGGVQPNPLLSHAEKGVQEAVAFGADFILAIGGGSVIDTAKAIAIGAANPDQVLWDFWEKKASPKRTLPVGAILTIPAAGSEMSDSAVLTKTELGSKRGLSGDWNRPKFAVMNPELTYTLPPFQIACGITDIMMHTLDRYFTTQQGNGLTDEIAEGLLRDVMANGRKAMENPKDYDARSELMWCSSISHNGLTGLGGNKDFAVHQLGHTLSARFGTAHGASLSAVWGAWANYVMDRDPSRFARYGRHVLGLTEGTDLEIATAAIELTVSYFGQLKMPVSLGELEQGVLSEEMLVELTDICLYRGGRESIGTFKKLERSDIYEIYRAANR